MCVAAGVVFLVGCGGSDVAKPVAKSAPAAEQAGSSTEDSTATAVADGENADLKREPLKIAPYEGPAILLDEPQPSPPPTVVAKKIDAPVEKYEDGTTKIERQVTKYSDNQFVNDGLYREYFPNGQKFIEGNYEIGEKKGAWKYWYENGQLRRSIAYVDGKPNGEWEVFRADGTLEAKRSFKAGQRDGEWLEYDPTGDVLLRRMPYRNGKPHGKWDQWLADGQEKASYVFVDGQRDGPGFEWDDEGNKRGEFYFKAGKLHGKVTHWTADGKVLVQEYKDGKIQSESIE